LNLNRYCAIFALLIIAALSGCGSGGSGSGSGGGGTPPPPPPPPPFQARPFPGDFLATPPAPEFGSILPTFPANVVYDAHLNEFLFSNNALNEVEAYSAVDGHRVGAVTVPGAMGLSLSPDGTRLAVGTSTPHIYFVDPAALHVTGQIEVPASLMDSSTGLEPVMPFLMASGPMFIEAAVPTAPLFNGGKLLSYDPATGKFAVANPPGAVIGVFGAVPARSGDGNYLAVPILGPSDLQVSVYSAKTQNYIGSTPPQYGLSGVAANPDGSQFAVVSIPSFGATQVVTLFNRNLDQLGGYPTQNSNIVYSRDGAHLYIREMTDVLAVDTHGGISGYQGLALPGPEFGTLWDTDESNRVYGISLAGAFVASLTQLQSVAPQMPLFSYVINTYGVPNEGPLSGGTDVQFVPSLTGKGTADGIGSDAEAYFGAIPATNDVVAGNSSTDGPYNFLTATSPAASASGPVTVLITDASNNATFLPTAFSYGPQLHWIDPSAVSPAGGTVSTLWTDGLQVNYANNPSVWIGGAPVVILPPDIIPAPLQEILVTAPPAKPGWADLKISLQDGTSDTAKNMVQYLAQDVSLTTPGYTNAVYDSKRDKFYLAGANNTVGVFDPGTQSLLPSMTSSTVSSGAVLDALALTPDNSRLLVSDPADHSLVVFDLDANTSTAINLLLASDGATTLFPPISVAALKGNQAFVLGSTSATGEPTQVRQIDLALMTVKVRTDLPNPSLGVTVANMAASSDGSTVLFGATSPAFNPPFYVWKYDAASDSFSAPVTMTYGGYQVAINADGTVLDMGAFALDRNLLPFVPIPYAGLRGVLPGAGALFFTGSSEIQVFDTRNGRLLLSLGAVCGVGPDRCSGSLAGVAVDPTGKKVLTLGGDGALNYSELSVVPLAVATVTPASAAPGASLTIRGSGFVAGTAATIAGKSTSCTLMDSQTLQCTLPDANTGLAPMTLTNPDGQTYSLEAAIDIE
jgi:hypothetical protein